MVAFAASALFCGTSLADRAEIRLDGNEWLLDGIPVLVPNAWNKIDGADGSPEGLPEAGKSAEATTYARRRGIYSRPLPDAVKGRRYFIRCEGASQNATVRVNGAVIGSHRGAFSAFCFEATDVMKPSGNKLEIEVSNEFDPALPPVSADFTVCGGLYRSVWLVETDPVCIDPTIDGGPGVRVFPEMDGTVRVEVDVSGADDAEVDWEPRKVENPKLWSPETPNVYEVSVTVRKGSWRDSIRQPFGFRTVEMRPDGFYLNGVKRKVRGVNRHQDQEGMGWEFTASQEERDIRLVKEMGADGLRLAHYPQSGNIYDLCDRYGLLVWSEIPVVNRIGPDIPAFMENARTMLREMIAQNRNHPSVCWWGVFNEIYNGFEKIKPEERPASGAWEREIASLVALVHELDVSRPAVAATCRSEKLELNSLADAMGINVYPRWYRPDSMRDCVDEFASSNGWRTVALSEYGAGGSVFQHENPPVFRGIVSPHHPEEYMTNVHVEDWRHIIHDDRIWGSFVWAMFDFASDAKREGDRNGVNDKGLVTRDRVTPKDAWHFYRANWNRKPVIHLAGKRMSATSGNTANIVVFCNVGPVSLFLNGKLVETKSPDEVCCAVFDGVPLKPGANDIRVESAGLCDGCVWRRQEK